MKNKYFIFPVLFFIIFVCITVTIDELKQQQLLSANEDKHGYCSWLHNASMAIATNRDLGMGKIESMQRYLSQNAPYREQLVVLDVIDRAYTIHKSLPSEAFAEIERDACTITINAMNELPLLPNQQERVI